MSPSASSRRAAGPALQKLMHGVGEDLRDYRELQTLLEEQFSAALHHRAASLRALADRITALCDAIEQRRVERVALTESLAGAGASVQAVFKLCGDSKARHAFEAGWRMLETLVRECKRRNVRNGELMTEQRSIMQRVLHGEEAQIYAPA